MFVGSAPYQAVLPSAVEQRASVEHAQVFHRALRQEETQTPGLCFQGSGQPLTKVILGAEKQQAFPFHGAHVVEP